ncbi:unnamed protein product, partial [Anisakis simplex]|uniref:AKAP2_C domain-containing protein n=1 Tax=Anisakis simplex TaxID=6269 RepID=A0A0M3KD28_ANISI
MDETQGILERARQREAELGKENSFTSDLQDDSVNTAVGDTDSEPQSNVGAKGDAAEKPRRSSLYPSEELEEMRRDALKETNNNLNIDANKSSDQSSPQHFTKNAMRSRFAALSAELNNFECEEKPASTRSKESYVKGVSPRLSIGEIRPTALFTPTASYYPTAKDSKQSSPHIITKAVIRLDSVAEALTEKQVENAATERSTQIIDATQLRIMSKSSPQKAVSQFIRTDEKQIRFASPVCQIKSYTKTCASSKRSSCDSHEEDWSQSVISQDKQQGEQSSESPGHEIVKRESQEYGIHNFFKRKTPPEIQTQTTDKNYGMEHEQRSDSSNEEQQQQQYKSFVSATKHSDL